MKATVKLNLRDWPKRTMQDKREVEVEVSTRDDGKAMAKAYEMAAKQWPGGKVRAYDVIWPRQQPREILRAKVS